MCSCIVIVGTKFSTEEFFEVFRTILPKYGYDEEKQTLPYNSMYDDGTLEAYQSDFLSIIDGKSFEEKQLVYHNSYKLVILGKVIAYGYKQDVIELSTSPVVDENEKLYFIHYAR
jgi:hypothetical protein